MENMDIKKKVLDEIMSLMDDNEGERLKNHPKLVAAKVEVAKPELVAAEEKPEEALEEDSDLEGIDPEMLSQLLEKYQSLK